MCAFLFVCGYMFEGSLDAYSALVHLCVSVCKTKQLWCRGQMIYKHTVLLLLLNYFKTKKKFFIDLFLFFIKSINLQELHQSTAI